MTYLLHHDQANVRLSTAKFESPSIAEMELLKAIQPERRAPGLLVRLESYDGAVLPSTYCLDHFCTGHRERNQERLERQWLHGPVPPDAMAGALALANDLEDQWTCYLRVRCGQAPLTGGKLARTLSVRERNVRAWLAGEKDAPIQAYHLLLAVAGIHPEVRVY